MIIRSPPNRQRNVSHHGKENCRCIKLIVLIFYQGLLRLFTHQHPLAIQIIIENYF